ncbi:MAG: hypothetical protein R2882_07275 [Gemmatimonadales bacterium]
MTVAVPTGVHAAIGLHALGRGSGRADGKAARLTSPKPTCCSRPPTAPAAPLQVGHVDRFNRAVRAAEPFLGEVRYFESTRLAPYQPRGTDVAVILDLMIHDLDLVLHLCRGSLPRDVRASGVNVLTPRVDIANARVEFDNGAVANITASRAWRGNGSAGLLFQTNGYFSLDLGRDRCVHAARRPLTISAALEDVVETIPLEAPERDALGLELASFVASVAGTNNGVVTGAEGRAALASRSGSAPRSPGRDPGPGVGRRTLRRSPWRPGGGGPPALAPRRDDRGLRRRPDRRRRGRGAWPMEQYTVLGLAGIVAKIPAHARLLGKCAAAFALTATIS